MVKTVSQETVIEFEEKKSKFIGYIKPIKTVEAATKFIHSIKIQHSNATHNVSVYRVIENGQEYLKYDDDGEPNSTAGKPMAEIMSLLGIYNVVIVATRYFGGVKLGAGGLIRNYAKTAKLAIQEAKIIDYIEKSIVIIDFDYKHVSEIEGFIKKNNIVIVEKNYSDRVTMKIEIDEHIERKLQEMNYILIIKI